MYHWKTLKLLQLNRSPEEFILAKDIKGVEEIAKKQ